MELYKNREEAKRALGYKYVDKWSDYDYDGFTRLVVWDDERTWFNNLYESKETGAVEVYGPEDYGKNK